MHSDNTTGMELHSAGCSVSLMGTSLHQPKLPSSGTQGLCSDTAQPLTPGRCHGHSFAQSSCDRLEGAHDILHDLTAGKRLL